MTLPVKINGAMLPESDWTAIGLISEQLSHAYTHRQIFRTETEARVSVLDDVHFPTKASKWWQSVREQCVMLENLAMLSFDFRRNEVKIKKLTKDLTTIQDEYELESVQIDLDECLFKKANMETVAKDRAREVLMWEKLKGELNDGSFDTTNVDSHQLVSYATQFAIRAAHANPDGMNAGEWDNLRGLVQTTLKRCKEQGVMDSVIAQLPKQISQQFLLEITP